VIRQGSGEPLVLYHGIICSGRIWRRVVPLLSSDFEVLALDALGHRGGPTPTSRPTTIEDIVDAAERQLDELGIEQAHLAGNSMGGWMALELARRGRAKSVCAIAPAGFWEEDWADRDRTFELLRKVLRDTRRGRRLAPPLSHSKRFRRWALREGCLHGDRVSREEFLDGAEDTLACGVAEEVLRPGFSLSPLQPSCPVTVAWAEADRLFPLALYEPRGPQVVPGAEFIVLEGVGHLTMHDDPQLTADTIRAATRAVASLSSPGS
jgi:pimeloyl-ACP methyl ester carboxylesterase